MHKTQNAYRIYLTLSFLQAVFFYAAFTIDSLYYVITAHLDPLQLVLVGTTLELSVLLFEIPTGIVADLYSRRLSTIIGFFLIGIGFLVQGAWAFFLPILAAQLLWGTGYTFTSGAVEAWISDEIGEENAGEAFLNGAQRGQFGAMTGIVLGTLLGTINLRIPILTCGVLFLCLAVYLLLKMPEEHFKPAPREALHTWGNMRNTFKAGFSMLRVRPALISILAIGFFYGLYSEGFDRLWVALMLDRFVFPLVPTVIWFGGIHFVEAGLSSFVLGHVRNKIDLSTNRALIRLLILASAGLSLALVVFAFAGMLWLAIGMLWLIGILRGIIGPLHTTWVNQKLDPQVRATVISMAGQVDAIGQIAGGPGVGLIARLVSIPIGIFTSATLLTPVLALLGKQYARNNGSADTGTTL